MMVSRETLLIVGTQRPRLKCSTSSNASTMAETGKESVVNCILLKLSPENDTHFIFGANPRHITMPNLRGYGSTVLPCAPKGGGPDYVNCPNDYCNFYFV